LLLCRAANREAGLAVFSGKIGQAAGAFALLWAAEKIDK
jgi:hypothetical protein